MTNQINQILAPVNFDEVSMNALNYALDVAHSFKAKIVLLHAFSPEAQMVPTNQFVPGASLQPDPVNNQFPLNEITKQKLEKLVNEIEGFSNIDYELLHLPGIITETIKEVTAQRDINLTVIGTKGASGLKEIFVGTTADRITRKVDTPIMVVPQSADYQPLSEINVALDFSDIGENPDFDFLINLAKSNEATLNIFNVIQDEELDTDEHLIMLKNTLKDIRYSFSTVLSKNIEKGIFAFQEETGGNLMVIFYKEHKFLDRMINHNITQELVFHSNVPLLVIK
ncbi:MAG TPA: universal stress protein [Cyclobacteriaceae bacterium]